MAYEESMKKNIEILNPWKNLRERDPERIDETLKLLEIFWKKNPDLRLGQIIENAASRSGRHAFYMEDNILQEWLKKDT